MERSKEKKKKSKLPELAKEAGFYLLEVFIPFVLYIFLYAFRESWGRFILYGLFIINMVYFLCNRISKLKKALLFNKDNGIVDNITPHLTKICGILFILWWNLLLISIVNGWNLSISKYVLLFFLLIFLFSAIYYLFAISNFFNKEELGVSLIAIVLLGISMCAEGVEDASIRDIMQLGLCFACFLLTALLIKAFIHGKPIVKNFMDIFYLCSIVLLTIVLTIYAFYKLFWVTSQNNDTVDNSLFSAVVGVYAALVGGGLTLAGVAWTIKKSEDDKKEERRNQCIPYLTLDGQTIMIGKKNNDVYSFDIRNGEKIKGESEDKKQYSFSPIRIKNVSNSIVIIAGVCIDNTEFLLKTKRMIEKENSKIFIFKGRYESISDVKEVFLIAEDVLKNKYYLKCCFLTNLEENKFNTNVIDINNAGYKDLLQCKITGIELPIFKGAK